MYLEVCYIAAVNMRCFPKFRRLAIVSVIFIQLGSNDFLVHFPGERLSKAATLSKIYDSVSKAERK